jgi:hypothetical protein
VRIFGFEFKRAEDPALRRSFAPPTYDDGAVVVASGGVYGTYIDLEGIIANETDLVTRYRQLALQPEIDKAINEICNEAIIIEEGEKIVDIILDDIPIDDRIKEVISIEFDNILDLMNFNNAAYDIFRRWYIDGRNYYHVIIDDKVPQEGIKELRYIDPRKIRKIREVMNKKDPETNVLVKIPVHEYYVYNENGIGNVARFETNSGTQGIKINKDSIIHTVSGLTDIRGQLVYSYLHAAIKPMNMLRSIEDASIIYFMSRSPQRRVFYVDTGTMPHVKAKQYMENLIEAYKTKLTYNAETGEVKDASKTMSMLEDFWLQRREGGRGTEITTLQEGTQLSQLLEAVQMFEDKLYRALQVPISRLKPDSLYTIGRATEISRDEINFAKFIDRLRNRFSQLFVDALEKQLVLKNIVTPDDFEMIRNKIKFRYQDDNLFSELKDIEIMKERLTVLEMMQPFLGRYYSHTNTRKFVCKQSDEDIKMEDKFIAAEMTMPQYQLPEEEGPV